MSMNHYFTIRQYQDAGCMQFEVPALAIGLHQYTQGKMCNGCPKYHDGNCDSLKQMLRLTAVIRPETPKGETVREEAARRGLSIGEVRRQRNATGAKP